jgi:hypothetical protein
MLTPTEFSQLAERLKAARTAQEQAELASQLRQATAELLVAPTADEQPPPQEDPKAPQATSDSTNFDVTALRKGTTLHFSIDNQGRLVVLEPTHPLMPDMTDENFLKPFSSHWYLSPNFPVDTDLDISTVGMVHEYKSGALVLGLSALIARILKELTDLHDNHVINDEKYEKLKNNILEAVE